jgi:tetratricopeptide (TPR) repeat protein
MKCALAVITALTVSSVHASADPPPDPERLYQLGQDAYDAKNYDAAIAAWTRSYELSDRPELLFNIGQAYRLRDRAGDCALARDNYRRFVARTPDSPQRALAIGFVAQLGSCPGQATTPVVVPTATGHTNLERDLGIGTAGAGVVLVGIGIGFGHHASILSDDVTRACSMMCDWGIEKSKDAAGRRDEAIGLALDGVGAAAIIAGAVAYYVGIRQSPVEVQPRPGGWTLSWSAAW